MVLKDARRVLRHMEASAQLLDAQLFSKNLSDEVPKSLQYVRVKAFPNTLDEALLFFREALLWKLSGGADTLREISAVRWKGGWLLIVKRFANQKGGHKWYAYGDTFKAMLNEAGVKAMSGKWNWKD